MYPILWRYATVQKEVIVPLVDSATCQDLMRRTRLGQYFNLHKSFVCAGGQDGVDTCQVWGAVQMKLLANLKQPYMYSIDT